MPTIQQFTLRTTDATPTVAFTYTPVDNTVAAFQLMSLVARIATGGDTNKGKLINIASGNSSSPLRRDGAALTAILTFAAMMISNLDDELDLVAVSQSLAAAPAYQIIVTGLAGVDIDWEGLYFLEQVGP